MRADENAAPTERRDVYYNSNVKNSVRLAPRNPPSRRALPPTREALLELLQAQQAPLPVSALAEATGWHGNTVRAHLQALWEDGHVDRMAEEPDGRGRPSWLWRARERPAVSPYAALAGVLAETLVTLSPDPERDAHEAGRVWGLRLAAGSAVADGADELNARVIEAMREQGFSPEARDPRGASGPDGELDATIALRQCPLIEAANAHTDIVCAVHLGMIAGIAEALGGRDRGSTITPLSSPGECELRLAVAPAGRRPGPPRPIDHETATS